MYITTVIPIARGIPFDTLSYYSSGALTAGTLVTIPFGTQSITGIVTESMTVLEAKSIIKQASFTLKKITSVIGHVSFFEHVATAAQETATLALAPTGAVAASVIPSFLFEYINSEKISGMITDVSPPDTQAEESIDGPQNVMVQPTQFREDVLAGTTLERLDTYKRMVRSAFAEKKSILFIAPSIRGLETWKERLEKGIAKHIVVVHSKITKKNLRSTFSVIKSSERPLIIFATPGHMIIPRADLGCIIVEEESSALYKTSDRFAIDTRFYIKSFAERAHLQLMWGDTIPRFETLERLGKAHLPRSFVPEKLHLVSIDHYRTTLPSEVIDLIRHAEKKKRRLCIYTNRKGVAPLSRCSDCGTIVTCDKCTLPMVLRNKITSSGTERYFICTHCAATLPPTHTCSYCQSWNITPLSIGTESIRDAVIALVGPEAVVTIDDDLTPDSATITNLIDTVQKHKFCVIIGTIKVLPYLKNINYVLFPFFDRLLSTPSLYTTETALRLVMETSEIATDGVIICTRLPDFPLIKQLETHKINAIIEGDIMLRRELGYPPFGTLVKVSITVPEGYRLAIKEKVEEYIGGLEMVPLPARRVSHGSMKILLSWIITASTSYIEEEGMSLMHFLDTLRFPYRIEQNPERL